MCVDQLNNSDMPDMADMSVETLLTAYPKAAEVFIAHAMACVGCLVGSFHTLAQAADVYGLDIDQFMTELRNNNARQQALHSEIEKSSKKLGEIFGEDPPEECGSAR
jgi:hybrid cluster-associated redox disulfide protein